MIGKWGFDLATESFDIMNLLLIVVLFKVIITPKNDMMKS